jgi:hypothetical protein
MRIVLHSCKVSLKPQLNKIKFGEQAAPAQSRQALQIHALAQRAHKWHWHAFNAKFIIIVG